MEECGPHEIARVSNSGEEGVYTIETSSYKNLPRNTKYVLRAKPNAGDVIVKLRYKKQGRYCVTLDVENCLGSSVTACIIGESKRGCKYVDAGVKQGDYQKMSGGAVSVDSNAMSLYNYNIPVEIWLEIFQELNYILIIS